MWTRIRTFGLPFRALKIQTNSLRRVGWGIAVVSIGVVAFCWGRHGAWSQGPKTPQGDYRPTHLPPSDYAQRVVGYIYGSVPLTREALGEFLIQRFATPDRLEFFVQMQILELACKQKGIQVTDAEVEAQLREDVRLLTRATMNVAEFEKQLLKKYNKSLYEYKEDVVRPRLAISKLVRGNLAVTEEDLRKAFDAKYGPKVQCRWIQLLPEDRHRFDIHQRVSASEEAFAEYATKQANHVIAAQGGKLPPIHRHFGDPVIEKRAFSLKVGEVSELLQVPDKSWIILKCYEHIKANMAAKFEEERTALFKEVSDHKLSEEIPRTFARLREQATPRLLMGNNQIRAADLEREVKREIEPVSNQTRSK